MVVNPASKSTPAVKVMEEHLVREGALYGLRWMMKVGGEKPWRFRADFAGVKLIFADDSGHEVGRL
jgi:hypothetical protein